MRAAFYECDITPPLGGFLWGHYARKFAEDVYEKIFAKALVVEEGGELAAILEIDACKLPEDAHDAITKRIFEFTGIVPERVCVACTHTHSGASFNDGPENGCRADETYKDVAYRLCADAVTLAYKRLEEATASFGVTQIEGLSFCRNYELNDGTLITHGRGRNDLKRPLGVPDKSLSVLMFSREEKPVGALVNFANHPASVSGAYSGDYPGILSQRLKEFYGEDFITVFATGACGDVNGANPDTSVPPVPEGYDSQRHWRGDVLAEGVKTAMEKAQPVPGGVSVIKEKLEMDRREMTAEQIERQAIYQIQTGKMMRARNLIHYAAANDKKTTTLVVQVIRIGDVAITCLPGEVYTAYGRAIKEASPFKNNLVVENCNYYTGYIPTKECFAEGSQIYEAALCRHSNLIPEAGQILKDKALEILNDLANKL